MCSYGRKKNETILFENQEAKLEVNLKDETVWLTQAQMAELFGNPEFADKPTNYYNLDMTISVGYRVKSQNGILFRRWATNCKIKSKRERSNYWFSYEFFEYWLILRLQAITQYILTNKKAKYIIAKNKKN